MAVMYTGPPSDQFSRERSRYMDMDPMMQAMLASPRMRQMMSSRSPRNMLRNLQRMNYGGMRDLGYPRSMYNTDRDMCPYHCNSRSSRYGEMPFRRGLSWDGRSGGIWNDDDWYDEEMDDPYMIYLNYMMKQQAMMGSATPLITY